MEVKINKEIREFQESIFFGLSIRQCIFSLLACLVALILYFTLKNYFGFGVETLSWICILGAFPFAIIGFVTYNGMPAEKFIIAWLKNETIPKRLIMKKKTPLKRNTVIEKIEVKNVIKKPTPKYELFDDDWFDEIMKDIPVDIKTKNKEG